MTDRRLLRPLAFLATLLLTAGSAYAQSAACARYRAELAAIDSGSARPVSPAADRLRAEMARTTQYYREIGCEGGFSSIFGLAPPPECPSLARRLRSMEANYDRLLAEGDPTGMDLQARRQQLLAAIQQACPQQDARVGNPGNFLERLFGGAFRRRPEARDDIQPEIGGDPGAPLGGRRLVCVRTCDGSFFPISALPPGGRETADDMCQALCPGSETFAFAMPEGDAGIDRAVSLSGRPYTELPNALKYTKSFDPSCSCKREGESWAQALQQAEAMLGQRGDLVVSAQKAEELSRPKAAPAPAKDRKGAGKSSEANDMQAAAESGAAAPTAGRESSGIGPQSIENSRVIPRGEGPRREVVDSTGAKRTVRVIAPEAIPAPATREP